MSFQKFMRSLFKVAEGVETIGSSKPNNTKGQTQVEESSERLLYIGDAEITGTPWFVDLMEGFYSSNKSIVPPECWKLSEDFHHIYDLWDLESKDDYLYEILEHFKEAKQKISDMYFEFLREIVENKKAGGDPDKVGMYTAFTIHVLQPFVRYEVLQHGAFHINGIPAIEVGGEYYLEKNMMGQFKNLQEVVENIPELYKWKESLLLMKMLHKEVKGRIKEEPGILQKDIKKQFGDGNESAVQKALYILENQGKVERKKKGSSYELFLKE